MKTNEFFDAMGKIDPALIERADKKVVKKRPIIKIMAIAAAVALLAGGMIVALPLLIGEDSPEETVIGADTLNLLDPVYGQGETAEPNEEEHAKYPIFEIVDYKYSDYRIRNAYPKEMHGEIIGEKIEDITVFNGWGYFSDRPAVRRDMTLVRAEVYAVKGVAPEAGVAIKFIEEGPFNSLEHYYAAVNTDYEYTTFAQFLSDYNAPVFMTISEEAHLEDDTVEVRGIEYKKYIFKNAANDEIVKLLLTLDAPAEITGGYSTGDERIVDVKNKPTLNLIIELDSMGDNYNDLWVHENGYIAFMGFHQPNVFFNVGKEATDAILKLFYENSEHVSTFKMGPNNEGLVEYPVK